jgi:diguanylate cyclase (GGDEF)-like protein
MVDIDHFKNVNDTHGHPAGDEVLRNVAERLMRTVRGKGRAYRYGGEEIMLLLPNHTSAEATVLAERARRALEASPISGIQVTASFGVASFPEHASKDADLVKKVDAALYDAKNLNRNLVRVSGEPTPTKAESREPERRQADPGRLTAQQKAKMREDYFKKGRRPRCPFDDAILRIQDTSTTASVGSDFWVVCPLCGLSEEVQGPQR